MPILDKGAEEAERISDENKRGGGIRIKQLVIKDGESYAVHFVTEQTKLVPLPVHQFIPTKEKPAAWPGDKYPETMWAICQNGRPFRLRDEAGNPTDSFEEGYGNCYIHTAYAGVKDPKYGTDRAKPADQVFGLAVLREPTFDSATNEVTGFRDKTIEFKAEDGTITVLPEMVIVNQKYSNFWHPVKATAYTAPHTILDKDFLISRKGKEYTVGVACHTPDLRPGTPAWKKYEEALVLMDFDLDGYLLDHATPDHYARFFIPGVDPAGGYGRRNDDTAEEGSSGEAAAVPAAAATAGPVVDQAVLAGFRDSLKGRGQPAKAS
jgi:hypothetical protein